MKIARFFAVIFAIAGVLTMVFTVGLCLVNLDAAPYMAQTPQGAEACAEALRQRLDGGDLAGAAQLLYGQPELGVAQEPRDQAGAMIWEAFRDSLCCEFAGEYYVTEAGIARDLVITALDIGSVTDAIGGKAHALMTEAVAQAEDMDELYDENNDFRPELVESVLQQAVVRALAEEGQSVTHQVTVTLVCRDGQWWAVPDQALLAAVSGGLA